MTGLDKTIVDYRDAKDRVCDAAAVWHGWNEPRRADRMTAQEVALFDAVDALLAAGEAMRDADAADGR